MKRKRIILVALAVVLVVAAGIAVWRLLSPAPGLSAPIEMVEIQPGEFLMGSPEDEEGREDDETQHLVRITYAFKMGKYEVTQKQWREVMGTTIQQQQDKAQGRARTFVERVKQLGKQIRRDPYGAPKGIWRIGVWNTIKWMAVGSKMMPEFPLSDEGDGYPIYYVSWDEAMAFCARLTKLERAAGRLSAGYEYRLPTEAEWEYACRAGSTTRFANGNTDADLDAMGWHGNNSDDFTHPVGMKRPNAWGLYDMHGNVCEWCLDRYVDYPATEVVDPFGPATGSLRVARGGSWHEWRCFCRSAYRVEYDPSECRPSLGFRVVLAPVRTKE